MTTRPEEAPSGKAASGKPTCWETSSWKTHCGEPAHRKATSGEAAFWEAARGIPASIRTAYTKTTTAVEASPGMTPAAASGLDRT